MAFQIFWSESKLCKSGCKHINNCPWHLPFNYKAGKCKALQFSCQQTVELRWSTDLLLTLHIEYQSTIIIPFSWGLSTVKITQISKQKSNIQNNFYLFFKSNIKSKQYITRLPQTTNKFLSSSPSGEENFQQKLKIKNPEKFMWT